MKRNKTKSREKRQAHMLHHVLTHLINSQVDLISYFQAPIQCSYVKHVASSDLNILHSEFCFLYKEEMPHVSRVRGQGETSSSQRSELQLETSWLRASGVCTEES